jgi:hypothetical protein
MEVAGRLALFSQHDARVCFKSSKLIIFDDVRFDGPAKAIASAVKPT